MKPSRKYFLMFSFFFLNIIFPQTPQVITISPSFNEIANNNHPEITATFNVSMDSSSFNEISFAVFAERSGYHSGTISYFDETKTVTFSSNEQFNAGERVTVMLSNKIQSQQGDSLNGFNWVFRIPSGIAPVNFGEAVSYGGGGYFMQCIDMNNDNYPDIVTSSGVILLNNGNGVFNDYWLLQDAFGDFPLIADDFNRDGIMDVYYSSIESPRIGLGDGFGNFTFTPLPYWFYQYISADFNGDGYPDIAGIVDVTYLPPDSTTLNWSIAFNDGSGNFNDTIMYRIGGGGKPTFIITTDIENDGDADIVIGSQPEVNPSGIFGLDGMIVGKNDGSGHFDSFDLYPTNTYLYISCAFWGYTSDFNNDGFNDVAVMGCFAGIVALNLGNGTFGYEETNTRPFWFGDMLSSPIAGGDTNGDSWIDIVISGYEWPPELQIPNYAVLINDNSYFPGLWNMGNFNDTLPTGYVNSTDIVDLNNDNRLDIVHNDIWNGVYITFNQDTISSVDENELMLQDFYLSQNFPNPFNGKTIINLEISESELIRVSIYNILGEEVRLLENNLLKKGKYILEWDGKSEENLDLPSGVYIIRASSIKHNLQIKTVLLK
jgi:hypothetical protein